MKVMKFGGSSVANATNISRVLDLVCDAAEKDRVILVCSAVKGCTDALISAAEAGPGPESDRILTALENRHSDIIVRLFTGEERKAAGEELDGVFKTIRTLPASVEAYGEVLSTRIIARKLSCDGCGTKWLDSCALVRLDPAGRVDEAATYSGIKAAVEAFPDVRVFVAPGFCACASDGSVTTLGRGGSDYSASLYAAAVGAGELEIWTDVPGMMTSNPKDVMAAKTVPFMSYTSALHLAKHGAKVLYAPAVAPVMEAGIPFRIVSTFEPSNPGTLVASSVPPAVPVWKGVTSASVSALSSAVSLVGEGDINTGAVYARMARVLKENGIRILSSSSKDEGRVQTVEVNCSETKAALCALHREFFEDERLTQINLFIAGYGAVGKALLKTISESSASLASRTGRSFKVVGLSDSRHYMIDLSGIDETALKNGKDASGGAFFSAVASCAPAGSVLVDCTDSDTTGSCYEALLERRIAVISSNRRAISGPYCQYAAMKAAARENGVVFKYDTTVGAALPILESISSGVNSCDSIESIEALVSCTLNYVVSAYERKNSGSFASILRKAQDSGLTEPDPRVDLSGRDALRKLLILSREAGIPLEESDVEIVPALDRQYFDCSVEDFYRILTGNEHLFSEKFTTLAKKGLRERFIAYVRKDPDAPAGYRAGIRMCLVGPDSPFYNVSGTENIISIRSEYISTPLILRGAGEGARQAASGIINDILNG